MQKNNSCMMSEPSLAINSSDKSEPWLLINSNQQSDKKRTPTRVLFLHSL